MWAVTRVALRPAALVLHVVDDGGTRSDPSMDVGSTGYRVHAATLQWMWGEGTWLDLTRPGLT